MRTLCFVRGYKFEMVVESKLEERKLSRLSRPHVFCISGVCDHKVSPNALFKMHVKKGLHSIPTSPWCSLSTSPKIL